MAAIWIGMQSSDRRRPLKTNGEQWDVQRCTKRLHCPISLYTVITCLLKRKFSKALRAYLDEAQIYVKVWWLCVDISCVFFFSCFERLAGRRRSRHHLGSETQRAPFRGLRSRIPHPHGQEDSQTHPAHTAWSHYGKALCTYTAVKHSQENIQHYKKVQRGGKKDGTKTWRSPSCHLPDGDLRLSGFIPAASNNILQSQLSLKLGVPRGRSQELPWTGLSKTEPAKESEADGERL